MKGTGEQAKDRRGWSRGAIAFALIFAGLIAYPLSFGPVVGVLNAVRPPRPVRAAFRVAYAPLRYVINETRGPHRDLLAWYVRKFTG